MAQAKELSFPLKETQQIVGFYGYKMKNDMDIVWRFSFISPLKDFIKISEPNRAPFLNVLIGIPVRINARALARSLATR